MTTKKQTAPITDPAANDQKKETPMLRKKRQPPVTVPSAVIETPAETIADRAIVLGRRIVLAEELDKEQGPYRWGSHARNAKGHLYPYQGEKLAASQEYWNLTGTFDRVLTGIATTTDDGQERVTMVKGRHACHVIPGKTPVQVEIISASPLEALRLASIDNAEGMGFTNQTGIEQTRAAVAELCKSLTSAEARGKLGIPNMSALAKYGYLMDSINANPFASKVRPSTGWTFRHVSAEDIAKICALSVQTATKALQVLAGLYMVNMEPNEVSGMTRDDKHLFARTCAEYVGQSNGEKETPAQRAKLKRIAEILRSQKQIEGLDNHKALATAAINGEPIKPAKGGDGEPKTKNTYGQRIVIAIEAACAILVKDADRTITPDEFASVNDAIASLRKLAADRTKEKAETDGEIGDEDDADQEQELDELTPAMRRELEKQRKASARKTA